jgi:tetratricopeptide (TPR) repeat protein
MSFSFEIKYLTDLKALRSLDTKELEKLVHKYPYFQSAHILLAKHYYETDNTHYEGYLKKASSYAVDRSRLFEIVHEWKEEVVEKATEAVPEAIIEEEIIESPAADIVEEIIEEETVEEVTIEETKEEIKLPMDFDPSSIDETIASLIDQAEDAIAATEEHNVDPLAEQIIEETNIIAAEIAVEEVLATDEITEEEKEEQKIETTAALPETHTGEKRSFLDWIKTYNDIESNALGNKNPALEEQVIIEETITPEIKEEPVEEEESVIETTDEVVEDEVETIEFQATYSLPNRTPLQSFVDKEEEESKDIIKDFISLDLQKTIAPQLEEKEAQKPARKPKVSNKQFGMVSETLAIIYAKQGQLEQAIEIYQQLILQEPKKSTYFVGQIEKLQNLL